MQRTLVMRKRMFAKNRWLVAMVALGLGLSLSHPVAFAQSETEIQARRQLEFSKSEIAGGSFERALSSASAAFRLDPTLYDALVYKALAYEGLGELRLSEGLLTTYMDIRGELDPLPEAEAALARVSAKLGGSGDEEASPPDPGEEEAAGPVKADEAVTVPEGDAASSGEETKSDDAEETETDGSSGNSDTESASPEDNSAGDQETEVGGGEEEETVSSTAPSGSSKSSLSSLLPSDATLARLHLRHQHGILGTRTQVGAGLTGAGLGLAAIGGILMGVSSAQYASLAAAEEPTDQAAAVYAASMGMLGSGVAITAVGIPILVKSRTDLKALNRLEKSLALRPAPRLELLAQGLRLRF